MIVAIIPARGGSKGIPKKNLAPICGKPLVYWSIKAAMESELLEKVYVSTEDAAIADYCVGLGVEILERPHELALDYSTTIDTLNYHFCKDLEPNVSVCTLQPTSPIRLSGTIDRCLMQFRQNNPFILASGYKCKIEAFGSNNNIPRQKIDGFFYDDGNIYVHSPLAIKTKVWSSEEACKFFTSEIENYEIDTELDLKIADFLLNDLKEKNAI